MIFNKYYGRKSAGETASIKVYAPSNRLVSATKGEKVREGVYDTDHFLISNIDEYGDWDVSIEIPRLYLYKDGDECVDVTGGWVADSIKPAGHTAVAFKTVNGFDFNKWKTINIAYSSSGKDSAGEKVSISSMAISDTQLNDGLNLPRGENLEYAVSTDANGNPFSGTNQNVLVYVWQTVTASKIEKLPDSLHIYATYNSYTREIYVYKVWLE